jgi:isopentenyl-diphosphate delta-isomerase
LIGNSKIDPVINKAEVCDWKWVDIKNVKIDLADNSDMYTEWFKIIFEKLYYKLI